MFYVYILTSYNRKVLYTGITNDLNRRLNEHRAGLCEFTSRYKVFYLVYVQEFQSVIEAIASEKKIKGWTRQKKISLIKTINPHLNDLSV